jgi:hypothetical protein
MAEFEATAIRRICRLQPQYGVTGAPVVNRSVNQTEPYQTEPPAAMTLLTRALKTGDGRKTITRLGVISASTPVLGLRPMRCLFARTSNVPNDESFTVSPRVAASEICSRNAPTSFAASPRDPPRRR